MRTCRIVDSIVLADHRVKLKENENNNKYLDLTWESKKLWNMKVTIEPIIMCVFGIVTDGLIKRQNNLKMRGVNNDNINTKL